MTSPIRVFIGTDNTQLGPSTVLDRTIREKTSDAVEIQTMENVKIPEPGDVRHSQRTGFSFARWAIPELCGYQGRAIYLDSDMLVFSDIAELWETPLNGASIGIVDGTDPSYCADSTKGNRNETSVMVIDCAKADWSIETLVKGLGAQYTYQEMMNGLCFLPENRISRAVPRRWNAMDFWDQTVSLLHYTNVPTQPWVSTSNPFGHVWVDAVKRLIREGKIEHAFAGDQIEKGYFRPSLLREIEGKTNMDPDSGYAAELQAEDAQKGFVPHRDLMVFTQKRERAIKAHELSVAMKQGMPQYLKLAANYAVEDAKTILRKAIRRGG